jgi:alkaline phosphatase D
VELNGLDSDRWYFYRFRAGEAVSAVGRTRTFPAPDAPAARLRLAFASCQRWEHGYYGAYRHIVMKTWMVLFLGDYIYEYRWPPTPCAPSGGWVLTLDDTRTMCCTRASPNCRPCTQPAPGW